MIIWFRAWKDNHMVQDYTVTNETKETRTHKIFAAVDEVCYAMDLSKPIWLNNTVTEFKAHGKTRFYQDNFMDEIPFDYLEIEILEED